MKKFGLNMAFSLFHFFHFAFKISRISVKSVSSAVGPAGATSKPLKNFIAQRAIKNTTNATIKNVTISVISCPYITSGAPAFFAASICSVVAPDGSLPLKS